METRYFETVRFLENITFVDLYQKYGAALCLPRKKKEMNDARVMNAAGAILAAGVPVGLFSCMQVTSCS